MKSITSFVLIVFFNGFVLLSVTLAQSVRVGYNSDTVNSIPYFVGEKQGFYGAEGLNVELIRIGSPVTNIQSLIAGEIQIASGSPEVAIIADEKGQNLVMIAGTVNAAPYSLIGGKSYRSIEDLRGAKLGVASLTGGGTTLLREYLRRKRLVYPKDYALVQVGGTPLRLAALRTGAIAAGVLGTPFSSMATDSGLNNLGDIWTVLPEYQFMALIVDSNWAAKNRTTVVKFLKAHIRSLRWVYNNHEEAINFTVKRLGLKPSYARRALDDLTESRIFPKDGDMTMKGLRVNIELMVQDASVKQPTPSPEKYVDFSYLEQAKKELQEKDHITKAGQ